MMTLDKSKAYSGFRILQTEYVEEVASQAYLMEHTLSGARLLYLENKDDNKVFNIGFRTPPNDDTGVAHILEHSTLCGSRKFRLKEPFVELVKGSLNTFLNAMTYPDKTVYPVASRNDKDFRNLMDVYLDAVFYPLIYENEYTLRQEGWHYNLETPEGELSYNGVVYNEMKGVYSSANAWLDLNSMRTLFPDTPYRFESGGLPSAIPQLTQQAFEDFHKTYYSPENSYIYLYGDMAIEDNLALLDEYLAAFPKTGRVHSEIPLQKPFDKTVEVEATYPVAEDEDTKAKTFLQLDIVVGQSTDIKTTIALKMLEGVLLHSEAAPLRRALIEAGIANDISGSFAGSMRQPVFTIKASGSEPEQRDKFISVIYRTLQQITREGLDKELLEAALNYNEFKLREADFGLYPKGLIYGLGLYDAWIYDANPIEVLKYNQLLIELRRAIGTRYYEQLIESYLLDNTHKALITLTPEPGKEEREQAETAKKMAALKATMSEAQLQEYIKECAILHKRQATPDSPEALASIPLLDRSDIKRENDEDKVILEGTEANRLLYVPLETNQISYFSVFFDMTGLDPKLLPYCNLLSDALGKFNTDKYTYAQLSKYTNMYTGGVGFQMRSYENKDSSEDYTIKLSVIAKVLTKNCDKLFDILAAVTTTTHFDDLERFKQVVGEVKTDWDNSFFARGQSVALSRLASYYSPTARVNEQDNFSYYQFIKDLYENFETKGSAALKQLQQLLAVFFEKSVYTAAYSCDEADKPKVQADLQSFLAMLPESSVAGKKPVPMTAPGHNEGILTPGKVQYVAAGGNFKAHGHSYTGAMLVLATLLRYEYLWTKIRVQGGAYGANATFERSGGLVLSTYRDPKLQESLEAFKGLPAWLRQLELSPRELTKYVIGTMSGFDIALTNSLRVPIAAQRYFTNSTAEARQQIRNEILDVTMEDITALAQVVEDVLADNNVCVVGGKQAIEAAAAILTPVQL